jgi:N-acetylmuramoyl-L-alanine amidase
VGARRAAAGVVVAVTTATVLAGGPAAAHVEGHVVRPGETLSQIARRHGLSTSALASANGIADPDRVRSGTRLQIAAGGGGSRTGGGGSTSGARAVITAAAQRHGWRPAIPLGLAMQESGWNNGVVSSAGARGLMQVLPATAEWVGTYLTGRRLDLADPEDNAEAGVAYLDYLYDRFDRDVELALAAYYEGPRRVEQHGPSQGARRYVANVLALAERYA